MREMRGRLRFVLTLGLAFAGPGLVLTAGRALAHGVGYRQASFPAAALEFLYSTGETMSYIEARVFSPADGKFAHQTGRTDAAGRFAFVPDAPGTWRVIVRDDEGHQAEAGVEVTRELLEGGAASVPVQAGRDNPPEGPDLVLRAALGVSLLFNLAAFTLAARHGRGA